MFEQASRLKLRFDTDRGNVTTEDLWDLPLTSSSNISLDCIAKGLNKAVNQSEEESFVVKRSTTNTVLELKFDIVKHVISAKLDEIESNKKAGEKKDKREKILNILADKEDSSLKNMSAANLKKMLNDL